MRGVVATSLATAAAAALVTAGVAVGSTKATPHTMTIYSVATVAQFINHQDDRERAKENNPFNTDTSKLSPNEQGKGPFAGDTTIYQFTLYTSPSLKSKAGTASYTCSYNFHKQALCSAFYVLRTGTLLATGPVDFNQTKFTLAVTGGTRSFAGANGQVAMAPVTKEKQRLSFQLLGT